MTNQPPGYGYPSDQNPYGQQPAPGYGAPQGPYDQQSGQGYPPPPPPGYPQGAGQLPQWLGQPGPYGPQPGNRTLANPADRFLARLIDFGILLIPLILVQFTIALAVGSIVAGVIGAAIVFGYEGVMMLTQSQQSIGKKVMKLRVVSAANGGRPSDNELWIRSAVFGLPQAIYLIGSLFSLVNVLSLLWDKPLQQCFHDKAAKTVVVKEA
ncbi:RDD family protein [Streptomyces sp. H51]|uniref:RDD family protein n=1 Tax=Streptomyces sp. H51 TaxID=3111770 RepID=UPI002D7825A4|nr:RDD family protein [Streptomyces sp. H51]